MAHCHGHLCHSTHGPYFPLKNEPEQFELPDWLQRLSEAVTFISRRFQAAIALMLGFYSVQNMNWWNQVRDIQSTVMGTINDVAVRISWSFPTDEHDTIVGSLLSGAGGASETIIPAQVSDDDEEGDAAPTTTTAAEQKAFKLQLVRWLNLAHAMVIGDVHNRSKNEFSSLEKLRDCGVLATDEEYRHLKNLEKRTAFLYVAPLAWFLNLLEQAKRAERFGVTDGIIGGFTPQLLTLRRGMADLYRIRNVPIPLCYRQLTNLTVRVYMIMLLLAAALFEKQNEDSVGRLTPASFWILLVWMFEYMLFVGWLTVADSIGNPFRQWSDGLEWDNYVKGLYSSSTAIAAGFPTPTKILMMEEDTSTACSVNGSSSSSSSGEVRKLKEIDSWNDECLVRPPGMVRRHDFQKGAWKFFT